MLTLDQVKLKSQSKLVGLQPVVVAAAVALIERCYARGVYIVITQGLRTIAEQDALYAQGRTKPGNIVTNAEGGHSYHNFGLAIDFVLLMADGKAVSWDADEDYNGDGSADWLEVVKEAKALGFGWGGDWKSSKDYPHFDMTFGLTTAQLRIGQKPTVAQIAEAYAVIDKLQEEADELSAEDKKRIDTLEEAVIALTKSRDTLKDESMKQAATIKEQANQISELSTVLLELTETNPPAWSLEALKAFANTPSVLNGKPVIDTPDKATHTEARIFTVLYRLGLAAQQKGDK